MFTKKTKTKLLFNLYANLMAGLLLAGAGIVLDVLNSSIIENKKALFGLSLIPLGLGLYSLLNLMLIKKYPEKMKPVVISENDERLVAFRNKSDAITFQILQWALMLVFFGYTFLVPDDIFETAAWWIVFGFFFLSHMLPGILLSSYLRNDKKSESDE